MNGFSLMLRKCRCGVFKTTGHRWRVLERREEKPSLVKCLSCGHKWHSRRKYVAKLGDHKEANRSGMTDQEILLRIEAGTLVVDSLGRFVISTSFKGTKHLDIWERERKGTMYRFASICHQGKKKKIAIHRLVWMAKNLKTVPDGFDVDHINNRFVEHPDGIDNLRLLPMEINRPRTYVEPEGAPF